MGGNTGRQDGPGTNANAGYQQAESWKFPIKNELDYKGRITFRAYKEVTESLGELVGTVSSEVVDLAGGTGTEDKMVLVFRTKRLLFLDQINFKKVLRLV